VWHDPYRISLFQLDGTPDSKTDVAQRLPQLVWFIADTAEMVAHHAAIQFPLFDITERPLPIHTYPVSQKSFKMAVWRDISRDFGQSTWLCG